MYKLSLIAMRIVMAMALLCAATYGIYGYWESRAIEQAENSVQGHIPCDDPARLSGCDWGGMTSTPIEVNYSLIWVYTGVSVAAIIAAIGLAALIYFGHKADQKEQTTIQQ